MNTEPTPHNINIETVESIVDKYITLWGFTPAQTKIEIHKSFEMDESQIQRALDYLDKKYGKKKAPVLRGIAKWPDEPGYGTKE